MQTRRMGLLCGALLLSLAIPAYATGTAPAKEPIHILLAQERELQEQVKQVHQQLLDANSELKMLEEQIAGQRMQTHIDPTPNLQNLKQMTEKYSIVYLPLAMASQMPGWPWEPIQSKESRLTIKRNQLEHDREALQTKEKQIHRQLQTLSSKISRLVGTPNNEGSMQDLNLEKLADVFAWPVPATKEVSSDYGWRQLNGDVEFHSGIDVAANLGDPIEASADGVVLYAGPATGFGNWIVIRHQQGLMTIYGHMYRNGIKVKPGQQVVKGQVIGKVGSAGQSYGPHLHFAVAIGMKGSSMVTVNPWSFLDD